MIVGESVALTRVGADVVGETDGSLEGEFVGMDVTGDFEGLLVGFDVTGLTVGSAVGSMVGLLDGLPVGNKVGDIIWLNDGESVIRFIVRSSIALMLVSILWGKQLDDL